MHKLELEIWEGWEVEHLVGTALSQDVDWGWISQTCHQHHVMQTQPRCTEECMCRVMSQEFEATSMEVYLEEIAVSVHETVEDPLISFWSQELPETCEVRISICQMLHVAQSIQSNELGAYLEQSILQFLNRNSKSCRLCSLRSKTFSVSRSTIKQVGFNNIID